MRAFGRPAWAIESPSLCSRLMDGLDRHYPKDTVRPRLNRPIADSLGSARDAVSDALLGALRAALR